MIVSVGVDMIEVARIQRALEDGAIGKRFRDRVYTESEIAYCETKKGRGKYQSYAGRFAVKEAAMKALGAGWGSKVSWLNIEVVRGPRGKPEIALHNHTSVFAEKIGIRRLLVSITHTNEHALAYVLAQDD